MPLVQQMNIIKNLIEEITKEKSKTMTNNLKEKLHFLKFSGHEVVAEITWARSRAARGNHAITASCDQEGDSVVNVRYASSTGEICTETTFLPQRPPSGAVRRYVKQSRPTVDRHRSHAWQLSSVLLSRLPRCSPPPACVSKCLSSSSPSTGHNYGMTIKGGYSRTASPGAEI